MYAREYGRRRFEVLIIWLFLMVIFGVSFLYGMQLFM